MKYTGYVYEVDTLAEFLDAVNRAECHEEIRQAVLTSDRLAIDYTWDSEVWHLQAHSLDGIIYRGHFGVPVINRMWTTELRRFSLRGNDEILMGSWEQMDLDNGGCHVFWLERS